MRSMRFARSASALRSAPGPRGSMASSSGSPTQTPAERSNVRRSRRGMVAVLPRSNLAERPGAAAEAVDFEAHLAGHAQEQVRQRLVVLAVKGDVSRVLEAAARQQDRQVVVGVRRGVAK